jgi:formate C-acetyltransferase
MPAAEELRTKVISKAVRNIKRGYEDDESSRGMYRPEIRLDLQRPRLMTESFRQTEG